jgi:deoxyribodipyrimidine photo-lyase
MPSAIIKAVTGVNAIDQAINELYGHGYMHNHCRMYTASIICNVGKCHWHQPAQWMYYHLLDGDWASNACSWQWVAGIRSKKKYFVNQENINKYSNTHQKNTFLDCSYEEVERMKIPEALLPSESINLTTTLPVSASIQINHQVPTFIYNYYNLDPLWHSAIQGNRILLIEPDFFSAYPVSEKCMSFLLELSKNIPEIQIYVGSFESLCAAHQINNAIYKEHPLNIGYFGTEEARDWIVDELTGFYPSFFSYWKKIEKQLRLKYV